jgi:rod shape-determining protein MreB and related proteins
MARDIAIDLGTANTLVYVRDRGVVLNEPSVIALNTATDEVLAVGTEAKLLIGRTPSHIRASRPLRDGVVAQLRMTREMLRYFIRKVHPQRFGLRPRVLVCVPTGITEVEQSHRAGRPRRARAFLVRSRATRASVRPAGCTKPRLWQRLSDART